MLARQDGKVLVLLPYSYAQKIVPNSSKQRGKKNITYVSAADQVNFFFPMIVFLYYIHIYAILGNIIINILLLDNYLL